MRLIIRFAALAVLSLSSASVASAQNAGLYFLRVGPDAAAMGIGDAQVALKGDAYATYWNPAGLAAADRNSVAVSHHIWVANVPTYAAATRLGFGSRGALGFSVVATGTSDLEARDGPGDPSGLFGAQFLSVGASYGRIFGPIRLGVTAKYLSEEIFEATANGFAFDLGAQADLMEGSVQLGAALQHLGQMSELDSRGTEMPKTLRIGAAFRPLRILSHDDDASLLNAVVHAEASHLFPDETTRFHLGAGVEVLELVFVRLGYITNDELRSFTLGVGIEYEPFQVDYAYVQFESGFDGPGHVISLKYHW